MSDETVVIVDDPSVIVVVEHGVRGATGVVAPMPAHTIKGNNTASTADPQDLTIPQVKAELALTSTDVSDFRTAVADVVGDLNVYDTFNRTVTGGWGSTNTGQAWTIAVGPSADFSVAGGVGAIATPVANQVHTGVVESASVDQDFYADFTWASTVTGANIPFIVMVRTADGIANRYSVVVTLSTSGTWSADLVKVVSGVGTTLVVGFGSGAFTPGAFLRTRLQVRGTTLSAKVWAAGTPEPSTWQTSVTDSSLTSGTKAGLRVVRLTGNTSSTPTASFDNVHVYVPTAAAVNIATNQVENRHLYPMVAHTIKGNNTASTADPLDLTLAQVKTELNLTGTNTGDQTITLTGDVTGSGTGSFAATVAADAVDNTKAANMAQSTLKGRAAAAGTGDPTDLTPAQAKTLLAIANTDVSGLGTLSTQSGTFSGTHSGASSGTNTGDQTITLTGDVTGSGNGSFAATVAANAVDNTKAADMVQSTLKGRAAAAGTGDPTDLTPTQAKTLLAIANTDVSGLGTLATVSNLTGDVTSVGAATTLPAVGPGVTTVGDATHVAQVTLDTKGRVTALTSVLISGVGGGNAFGIVTGNSGTANSDAAGDTIAITGTGSVTTAATDTPDGLVITNAAATTTVAGNLTAAEKIELNSINGQNSSLAVKRVFRPGDYMVGNTFDPTGSSDSTSSFTAMMTAVNALGDRSVIELPPGVFKVDPNILSPTATAPVTIVGAGRGITVLIPNSGSTDFMKLPSGADGVQVSDFAIYNTSGTPFTTSSGILTNNADSVTVERMLFVDLFRDIQVSGVPYAATLNATTAISSVSPSLVAGDVGRPVSGSGIVPGTTLSSQAGTSGVLSGAATISGSGTIYIGNTIKCSIQKTLHSQGNGSAASVGVWVNNGQAGDTYIGPDVVMSNTGNTRRLASVQIVESGHYEITQANLTGSQNGIHIQPRASQSVAFGFHTNVLCDSNSINGMLMDANTATSTIKNIKSVNSWYSGTTVVNASAAAAGVLTAGAGVLNGVTFSNDRFLNNRTHGFEHGKGTDFRWVDCDMKGNSSVGSGSADGLNVAAGVSNWSINGGKFGGTDTAPAAGNQRYGINVAAGAGDNIKIAPDDLTGNVTGPLSMGATGTNVFINGCPGLSPPYSRGASSGSITTVITLSNMLIPKNSTRVGTTYRLTAYYLHSGGGTTPTFTCRIGATNDAVGSAATNGIIVSAVAATGAANTWGQVEFLLTVTATGASGNIQGNGAGVQGQVAFGTALAARASGAGFLVTDLTADRYLTLALVVATAGIVVHNSTIEVVNY